MVDYDVEAQRLFRKGLAWTVVATLIEGIVFVIIMDVLPTGFGFGGVAGMSLSITEMLMGPDTLLAFVACGGGWINGTVVSNVWGGISRWLYIPIAIQAFLVTYAAIFIATDVLDFKLKETAFRCIVTCMLLIVAGGMKLKWEMAE